MSQIVRNATSLSLLILEDEVGSVSFKCEPSRDRF